MMCATAITLCACTPTPADHPADQPFDPYEADNRRTHQLNLALDRNIARPIGRGYSAFLPDQIEDALSRFAYNLSLPRAVVNNILQGNMRGATETTYRFVVNSTIGLGGLLDTATELNMPPATDADFGQTLHVWGVRPGAYVELPVLGPSTERDTAGLVVDIFTNPLSYVLNSDERAYQTGAAVSASVARRGRYSATVDSVLYDSADSYAQSRALYLQNRRFELGKDDAYLDPYGDPDAVSYEDPYDQ